MAKAKLRRVNKTELELTRPDGVRQRFPFTYEDTLKVRDICKDAGLGVIVEDKLKEWIKNETAKRNWPFDSIKLDSSLGQALANRSFQRDGIKFINQHRSVLVADEPGLGKTLQIIAYLSDSSIPCASPTSSGKW